MKEHRSKQLQSMLSLTDEDDDQVKVVFSPDCKTEEQIGRQSNEYTDGIATPDLQITP